MLINQVTKVSWPHWVSTLQKPCMGHLFQQAGLKTQIYIPELLLQFFPAAEAKHFSMVIWVPSIKTTWCVNILLSLACDNTEYSSKTCTRFGRVFTYQIQSGFKQDFDAQNLLWVTFIFIF